MRRQYHNPVLALLITTSSLVVWQLQKTLQGNVFFPREEKFQDLNQHDDRKRKDVSYKLVKGPRPENIHNNASLVILFGIYEDGTKNTAPLSDSYLCNDREQRVSMPILEQEGVTDFHAIIDTSLNVVYIGDSVADQYTKEMIYAVQATDYKVIRTTSNRMQIAQVAKGIGGGIIAGLRVTGLMRYDIESRNWRKAMPPFGGGGWLESDVAELRRFVNQWHSFEPIYDQAGFVTYVKERKYPCAATKDTNDTEVSHPANDMFELPVGGTVNATCSCEEKDYDVAVYQFSPGWLGAPLHEKITDAAIDEVVNIVFEYFGVNTLILQTAHINNNMFNVEEFVISNQRIWDYAQGFREKEYKRWMQQRVNATGNAVIPPMRKIIVMDVGAFSTAIVLHNALFIGSTTKEAAADLMNIHSNAMESLAFNHGNADFNNATMKVMRELISQKLKKRNPRHNFSVMVPHLCGAYMDETQRHKTSECPVKSSHSKDGMHWCLDKLGGRFDAVVACLLKCSVKYEDNGKGDSSDLSICERRCNAQFMSLVPIDWNNSTNLSF